MKCGEQLKTESETCEEEHFTAEVGAEFYARPANTGEGTGMKVGYNISYDEDRMFASLSLNCLEDAESIEEAAEEKHHSSLDSSLRTDLKIEHDQEFLGEPASCVSFRVDLNGEYTVSMYYFEKGGNIYQASLFCPDS